MEQIKTVKLNKNLLSKLKSTKESEIIAGLTDVRKSGNPEYLPYLIELYRESGIEDVKKEVFKILCELKLQDTVPYLMDAIVGDENKAIKKDLLEACWQNGLKYTHYLPLVIDMVIYEDEMIAFEALTIIENMDFFPGDEILKEQIQKIEKSLKSASDNKKYFLNAILKFFNQ